MSDDSLTGVDDAGALSQEGEGATIPTALIVFGLAEERAVLFEACDDALAALLHTLKPGFAVGIGRFATDRIERIEGLPKSLVVGMAPHPSPASPAANRGWAPIFESALSDIGVTLAGP